MVVVLVVVVGFVAAAVVKVVVSTGGSTGFSNHDNQRRQSQHLPAQRFRVLHLQLGFILTWLESGPHYGYDIL